MAGWLLASLILAVNPVLEAGRYRQEALALRQAEQFTEAIALLEKAVALDPQHAGGWVLLGWTQHLAGRSAEGAQSLWQAVYRQPDQVEAYNALGIIYLVQGELPTAILLHSWASLLKPDNEIAYYNLSLAYQQQQQTDLAIVYAQTACNLEPANPHPFLALALAYQTAGQSEQALGALRTGLNLNPLYGDRAYVENLRQAGFSKGQIQQIRSMLAE
ncbi:MAG: tetratricopeptide repeat protein [Pseudanabaenaceae cyanobacterium]